MPDAAIVCKALQMKGDQGRMTPFQNTGNQCDACGCNSPMQGHANAFNFRVQKMAEVTQKRTLNLCSCPANLARMKACSIGQNRTESDT